MDILTHTLSGVAIGSVIIHYQDKSIGHKAGILFLGALGAALPDIDAISMWSGFDSTFGQWFNLSLTGKEIYSAKLWYSHHAFFHSLVAAIFFTVLLGLNLLVFDKNSIAENNTLKQRVNKCTSLLLAFFLGYIIHLFEDMLTPASSWGGVAFWWPSAQYSGGWGYIWWWNNYDVFLIICSIISLNLGLSFFLIKKKVSRYMAVLIFITGVFAAGIQVTNRGINYNYTKTMRYKQLEKISLDRQKEILGEDLFQVMQKIDHLIPVYF